MPVDPPLWDPDPDPDPDAGHRRTPGSVGGDDEGPRLRVVRGGPADRNDDEDGDLAGAAADGDAAPATDGGDTEAPADGEGWAVPGVEPAGDGEGRLSSASAAVLAETAAAWTALRLAQARCYQALTALQGSNAIGESGHRSLSGLLGDQVRINPDEVLRLARQARSLATPVSPSGTTVPAELPATAAIVADGVIGPSHVEIIRTTMRRLAAVTPVIDPEVLATTEAQLAGLAAARTPAGLAQAVIAILALLDPDGTAPDDAPAPPNELHYLRRRDGSLAGKFLYRDPAAAETLHTALSTATPPPETVAERDPAGPNAESAESQARRTLAERRAQAMLDLAGESVTRGLNVTDPGPDGEGTAAGGIFDPDDQHATRDEHPTTSTGAAGHGPPGPAGPPGWTRADLEGGERVALTLTLNYDALRAALTQPDPDRPGHGAVGGTGRLGLLGENTWVRPETARRLACDAELIPAVLGSRSEVLDLGRKMRIVNQALRRAVILRDRHCAHPGCRRRARRCQVHHIHHWIDGGESCLENCVLLCSYHHGLIHHSGWDIRMIDGLPWFIPPSYLDPHRRPRHNRPWTTVTHQTAA